MLGLIMVRLGEGLDFNPTVENIWPARIIHPRVMEESMDNNLFGVVHRPQVREARRGYDFIGKCENGF